MKFLIKDKNKFYAVSIPKNLKFVYQKGIGLSIFANTPFKKGVTVAPLRGKLVHFSKASREAVQFNEDFFIDTKRYLLEDFINHSCSPNVCIDFKAKSFIALRSIRINEEITINYLATEYDMQKMGTDFKCKCGAVRCMRAVRGFRYLTYEQQIKLKPYLSPFFLKKLKGSSSQ